MADETVGCGSNSGFAFFFGYLLMIKLIFLNLFIAIILLGYEDTSERENRQFNSETAEMFKDSWSKFDPEVIFNTQFFLGNWIHKSSLTSRPPL